MSKKKKKKKDKQDISDVRQEVGIIGDTINKQRTGSDGCQSNSMNIYIRSCC